MRPSGSREMPPLSTVGACSASRPMGLRLLKSVVVSPSECTLVTEYQPPAVVTAPMDPIATTPPVTPIVSTLVRAGCDAGACPPPAGCCADGTDGAAQAASTI